MTDSKIFIGYDKWKKSPIYWDLNKATNPHSMLIGYSGAGKTYQMGRLITELAKKESINRIYVFDVHGDIDDNIPNNILSTISYSENRNNGVNPLLISDNPEFGGIRKRIRTFISLLNNTSRKLGPQQEATLTHLIEDLFTANGIYQNRPETWKSKRKPNLSDLKRFTTRKLENLYTGGNNHTTKSLDTLNKKVVAFRKRINNPELTEEEILATKETLKKAYNNYIDEIQTGEELKDFIKYDSAQTLKSVLTRINNLENAGIFKSGGEKFDTSKKVYRFNLSAINKDEQLLFISTMAEMIFNRIRESGPSKEVKEYIVIDEAHLFVTDDADNPLNSMAKESRKFGLGLMLASQSIHHFSEDLIMNTAMKYILGIDETFYSQVSRKAGIDIKIMPYIKPRVSALVNLKMGAESTGWIQSQFKKN